MCPLFLRSRPALSLALLALVVSFSPSSAQSAPKPRVALIMKSLANEFFQTMEKGARDYQAQHADQFELISNGIKNETDVGAQINLVNQMIAQKVDAIVLAPADSKALIAVSKKAQKAGILVINIDNKFDVSTLAQEKVKIPFVGPDNRKGSKAVGDYLAKQLSPGNKVAILEGVPGAFNGIQRKLGFEDAMKEGKIDVVTSQAADWETAKANQVTSAIITQNPDINAILACNDSMALGAVAALKAAGKESTVKVVGFDNITAVQQLIKEDKMLATADQHGDQLAVYGIQYALDALANKGGSQADRETKVDLITKDSFK
ncbi:MAG TPA: sugar ABC transporter substrate-binding protein [Chthoniobacterales bacterium]|nr:sugar ABC transporter substrate-binding protein [Chthoniobacterales bacterium]